MIVQFFNTVWLSFSSNLILIIGGFILAWMVAIILYVGGAIGVEISNKVVIGGGSVVICIIGWAFTALLSIVTPVYIALVTIAFFVNLAS